LCGTEIVKDEKEKGKAGKGGDKLSNVLLCRKKTRRDHGGKETRRGGLAILLIRDGTGRRNPKKKEPI